MRALLVLCLLATVAHANTTVFLERSGRDDIPRFGGTDRAWGAIVGCVKRQYAPFAVDITDRKPARGPYITAVVGGLASQRGLDDETTNGVGPYDGSVIRDAVVNVFSQVGTGETDVENLCAVTAHEVGHALGLDHEVLCGDIMSYYLDQCGARTFIDQEAPCGEDEERACGDGAATQSSYQRLGALVGFRDEPVAAPEPEVEQAPAVDPDAELDADLAPCDHAPAPVARRLTRNHHPARGASRTRHHRARRGAGGRAHRGLTEG